MSVSRKQLDRIKREFKKLDDKFDKETDKCPKCKDGDMGFVWCKKHKKDVDVLDDMERLIDLLEEDKRATDQPGVEWFNFEVKLNKEEYRNDTTI